MKAFRSIGLAALLTAFLAGTALAAQPQVGLGTATPFAVLAGESITNTGPTTITGDVGLDPGSSVTGFASVTLHGAQHVDDAVALGAKNDLASAYTDAAGRTPVTAVATELGGTTVTAGVYGSDTLGLTGTLTLDAEGDPNAVFIFQAGSTLITAPSSTVALVNGASACNVYWQIGSSATLDTSTTFKGNILAYQSIAMKTGATLQGRALARNGSVTLDTNVISNSECSAPSSSPKLTYTGPTTAVPGSKVTLSATLKTSKGVAIVGATVTFRLNGVTYTATTRSSGIASAVTTAAMTPGSYGITVAFAGDSSHARASTAATLHVSSGTSQVLPATDTANPAGAASSPALLPATIVILILAAVVFVASIRFATLRPRSRPRD
jgi:hypothetical protein